MFEYQESSNINVPSKLKAIKGLELDLTTEREVLSSRDLHEFFSTNQHKKILVVEDDLTQTTVIEEMLLDINPEADIEWETNSDHAINRISANEYRERDKHYDLIICDVDLEGSLSGVDLMNYCKEINSNAKVVLISAHSKLGLKHIYFRDKAPIKYLKKPLDYGQFYRTVAPALAAS